MDAWTARIPALELTGTANSVADVWCLRGMVSSTEWLAVLAGRSEVDCLSFVASAAAELDPGSESWLNPAAEATGPTGLCANDLP